MTVKSWESEASLPTTFLSLICPSYSSMYVRVLYFKTLVHRHLIVMREKFVCLSAFVFVCHVSHTTGAFCVARWPTAAFESLGLRYLRPYLVPPPLTGSPRAWVELLGNGMYPFVGRQIF